MVYETLEDLTALDNILQVDAVDAAIRVGVYIAERLPGLQWRKVVDPVIERPQVVPVQRLSDDRVAPQVEEVLFRWCNDVTLTLPKLGPNRFRPLFAVRVPG